MLKFPVFNLILRLFTVLLVSSGISLGVSAQNICAPESNTLIIGHFNGVLNTSQSANAQLQIIKDKLAPLAQQRGIAVEEELFYNHHGALVLDLIEVFQQRLAEDAELNSAFSGRLELFWDLLRGGVLTQQIVNRIPRYNTLVVIPVRAAVPIRVASALSSLSNAFTRFDTSSHKIVIDQHQITGKRLLFTAHSQGNLFANVAYNYARPRFGQSSIGLIHIASAAATTNGPWVRASEDIVINALAAVASVPGVTHTISPASQRPGSDWTGHYLVETYLNSTLPMERSIIDHADTIIRNLAPRTAQASEGFFTVTLTWDGTGDVDLHVFEPNNRQVFYLNRQGTSGQLDFDNTVANGPENYFATCNPTNLQTGIYRVALNNFDNAAGRTATVVIKTARQGILGTFRQLQGPERGISGNATPIEVARIRVERNSTTGLWTAALVS